MTIDKEGNLLCMKRLFVLILTVGFLFPSSGASASSNSDIAEALTYSGCTWGLALDPNQFGMTQNISSIVGLALMYRLEEQGEGLDSWTLTEKGRIGYQSVQESWATAGALSSKWSALSSTLERGLSAGQKKWNSGATLGVSKNSASAVSTPKLAALCRIAQIKVTTKASKAKKSISQYVISTTGKYRP